MAVKSKAGQAKSKGGRPRAELSESQLRSLRKLAECQCPVGEIAVAMGISRDTLRLRFQDEIDAGKQSGRTLLRQKIFRLAMSGNVTMLVWASKNMLGWSDKAEVEQVDPRARALVEGMTAEEKAAAFRVMVRESA